MSFRWTENTTLKFVSKYVEHECLWNVKCAHYKNKDMKKAACQVIEKEMDILGFGEKEIKIKIKNIRSTYSQELKKIKDAKSSGAGTDTVYFPTVKWFTVLDASLRNVTNTLTESESNLASNSSLAADAECDENSYSVDTFPAITPIPTPTKKRKIAQLSSMVGQLKEIANCANTTVEENQFEVFGKHVGLQLKSLPLLLALEAQEHIQLYINGIQRQHIQNTSVQNRETRTRHSSYAADSPYSEGSINYNHTSNYDLEMQASECISSPVLAAHHVADYQLSSNVFPSGHINKNETQSNVTILSNDLVFEAMQNANVDDKM